MADNLDTALGVVTVEAREHVVVREAITLLDLHTLGGECPDELVVVLARLLIEVAYGCRDGVAAHLIVAERDRVVHQVANGSELAVHGLLLLLGDGLERLLLGLKLDLEGQKLGGILLRL